MYKVGVKQERFSEDKLNINKIKEKLPDAINEENKRINIDSSKKRACLQHMDYDNFHQMVLGANLVPVKKGSLENINDNKLRSHGLNTHAALQEIISKNYQNKEGLLEKYKEMYKKEEDLARVPKSQSEFEKYFVSKLKTNEERFKYMLNIPISDVSTIFARDVNPELLSKILEVFHAVVKDRLEMKQEETTEKEDSNTSETEGIAQTESADSALFSYIGDFMKLVAKSEGFDFCVCFLNQKENIKDICEGLQHFGYPEVEIVKKAYEVE